VLEGLTFHLVVYHCYPMLEAYARSANVSLENLWQIVNDSYVTNVAVQYAPHIIALGCIHIVAALTAEFFISRLVCF
jgi:cyclin C